jgi:hypothetical protein
MVKAASPEVVRAQQFEVVDARGRARIQLGMGKDGQTPGVWLYDDKGEVRAWLSLHTDGRPGLALFDEKGKPRTWLGLYPNGEPHLTRYDEKGEIIWETP